MYTCMYEKTAKYMINWRILIPPPTDLPAEGLCLWDRVRWGRRPLRPRPHPRQPRCWHHRLPDRSAQGGLQWAPQARRMLRVRPRRHGNAQGRRLRAAQVQSVPGETTLIWWVHPPLTKCSKLHFLRKLVRNLHFLRNFLPTFEKLQIPYLSYSYTLPWRSCAHHLNALLYCTL